MSPNHVGCVCSKEDAVLIIVKQALCTAVAVLNDPLQVLASRGASDYITEPPDADGGNGILTVCEMVVNDVCHCLRKDQSGTICRGSRLCRGRQKVGRATYLRGASPCAVVREISHLE